MDHESLSDSERSVGSGAAHPRVAALSPAALLQFGAGTSSSCGNPHRNNGPPQLRPAAATPAVVVQSNGGGVGGSASSILEVITADVPPPLPPPLPLFAPTPLCSPVHHHPRPAAAAAAATAASGSHASSRRGSSQRLLSCSSGGGGGGGVSSSSVAAALEEEVLDITRRFSAAAAPWRSGCSSRLDESERILGTSASTPGGEGGASNCGVDDNAAAAAAMAVAAWGCDCGNLGAVFSLGCSVDEQSARDFRRGSGAQGALRKLGTPVNSPAAHRSPRHASGVASPSSFTHVYSAGAGGGATTAHYRRSPIVHPILPVPSCEVKM